MAAGNVFNKGIELVAVDGFFNIRPSIGTEAVIHNITHSEAATLEFYDGNNYVATDSQDEAGCWMGMFLHCTYDKYYRVRNTSGLVNSVCCDGVQTL